jgi:hypothetical protein
MNKILFHGTNHDYKKKEQKICVHGTFYDYKKKEQKRLLEEQITTTKGNKILFHGTIFTIKKEQKLIHGTIKY